MVLVNILPYSLSRVNLKKFDTHNRCEDVVRRNRIMLHNVDARTKHSIVILLCNIVRFMLRTTDLFTNTFFK